MRKVMVSIVLCAMTLMGIVGCSRESDAEKMGLDKENPTVISIWHYYNGAQQKAFEKLVNQYNDAEGNDMGIRVETFAQGTVYELEKVVMDSVQKKAGASELPNIFSAYADTAYEVDQYGMAADLNHYLTKDEKEEYIESYMKEGALTKEGEVKIFPIAKATEVLTLNETDWKKFADATGAQKADFNTMEGLIKTAQQYYEWTDKQTAEEGDGKAFYGRDAMANYFFIGAKQLGMDILEAHKDGVEIHFDKEIIRKLWDAYYVPYIKGYFSAEGRFRSDDMKMGNVVAYTGSSSGGVFCPDRVIVNDRESYPIEVGVYQTPKFEDGGDYAVQQGAGMVVTKSSKKEIFASVQFLKWFTQQERNIEFASLSSYLPVKKKGNQLKVLKKAVGNLENQGIKDTLTAAVKTVNQNELYTPKATKHGSQIRTLLENALEKKSEQDRKAIVAAVKAGTDYKDAVKKYDSEQGFDVWYAETLKELKKLGSE